MKSFTWVFGLLFLLFSNVASAGLVSWSRYSMSTSYYPSMTGGSNVEIEDCGDETYQLQIKSIKVTPDIVKPGAEVTLEVEATLSETVYKDATAQVTVKIGAVTLLRKVYDLCGTLENNKDKVDLQCPIEKGNLKITQKITLPKETPRGDFRVYVNAYNYDDADLACFKIHADFRQRFNGLLQLGSSY
ncbi:ML domain-containing protein [Thamnidium elegans]|nr:ML domain-containing protein [Thamnidium elegans]